ncbi:MAG TPA: hypothetical protein VMF30_08665, partial [Pirellulales bacterium]|nr:hypothetical protein [Pirellulales bacterium]
MKRVPSSEWPTAPVFVFVPRLARLATARVIGAVIDRQQISISFETKTRNRIDHICGEPQAQRVRQSASAKKRMAPVWSGAIDRWAALREETETNQRVG